MKNRYAGDVHDFRKFGLLRVLAMAGFRRQHIVWELTPDDGSSDGNQRRYIASPGKWAGFEPELFGKMADLNSWRMKLCDSHQGMIDWIERNAIIPEASFENGPFYSSARGSRSSLVFFDPDNGIETASIGRGRADPRKYVRWAEIRRAWSVGASVLVYQHFPRRPREKFIESVSRRLSGELCGAKVAAYRTPNVLFLLAVKEHHAEFLGTIEERLNFWGKEIALHGYFEPVDPSEICRSGNPHGFEARTSLTHPLRIDAVIVPGSGGAIGMTICPGKKQANAMSGAHERDLGLDLAAIRDWGAEILVSLIQEQEYDKAGIANIGNLIPAGMLHLRLPIPDAGLPDAAWERRWNVEGRRIRAVLRRGGKVCVHCMGGLGRTGTIAARLLVEFGMRPRDAAAAVRAARPGAIETDEQLRYVLDLEPIWKRFDRARGCLVGGACGDALGAPVEFLVREEILARFGPEGILGPDAGGLITDDTQMSLFTAEGLIRAVLHGRSFDHAGFAGCLHHAYLRWLATQGEQAPFGDFRPDGWLYAIPELHALRAPGKTCLDALRASTGIFTPIRAINDRKGCGAVMRAAPVGVFTSASGTRRDAFELGIVSGRITHGHPSGYLSAGALACIIHDLMRGAALPDSIDAALALLRSEPGSDETVAALEMAISLARRGGDPVRDIAELGEGWVGEEALAIGAYCALRARNPEEGIRMAVNITGDSDSTGAIAGNILGARFGLSAIPAPWRDAVELGPVVQAVADDLLAIRDLPPDPDARAMNWWTARYPGW